MPAEAPPAIVHGDYRLGNILYQDTAPAGLIDSEIWSVTDPRVDLGWFLVSCDHLLFPEVGTAAPGMPSSSELVAAYEAAGGPVDDVEWFTAYAAFKMAAIMAHNLHRHRHGRYHDPFQERLPPTIAAMIACGRDGLGMNGVAQ